MDQLTYHVMGNGDLIESNNIEVPNAENVKFTLNPTLSMIPSAKVVVFYITPDGEIISDSMTVEFDKELKNYVSCLIFILKGLS